MCLLQRGWEWRLDTEASARNWPQLSEKKFSSSDQQLPRGDMNENQFASCMPSWMAQECLPPLVEELGPGGIVWVLRPHSISWHTLVRRWPRLKSQTQAHAHSWRTSTDSAFQSQPGWQGARHLTLPPAIQGNQGPERGADFSESHRKLEPNRGQAFESFHSHSWALGSVWEESRERKIIMKDHTSQLPGEDNPAVEMVVFKTIQRGIIEKASTLHK